MIRLINILYSALFALVASPVIIVLIIIIIADRYSGKQRPNYYGQ